MFIIGLTAALRSHWSLTSAGYPLNQLHREIWLLETPDVPEGNTAPEVECDQNRVDQLAAEISFHNTSTDQTRVATTAD